MLDILLPGFIAGLVLTGIHVYFGSHVLKRGIVFVDLALAQAVALGYAVGKVLQLHGFALYASGFISATIASLILAIFRLSPELSSGVLTEAFIGVIYVLSASLMLVVLRFTPHGVESVRDMLTGNLLLVSPRDLLGSALLYLTIGGFHFIFRDKFYALSDGEIEGRFDAIFWEFLFFLSFSAVVTSSVKIGGVFLVFSYLIIPALTVWIHTNTIRLVLQIGWILGILATSIGMSLSYLLDIPAGPAVTAVLTLFLIVSILIKYFRGIKGSNL